MSIKIGLRQQLLQQQVHRTPEKILQISSEIAAQVIGYVNPDGLKTAHIYTAVASRGEIDTAILLNSIRERWPGVQIEAGMPQPDAPFPTQLFDIIFVPMVGFDRFGFRLGMGGGWYDRWLATQHHALKVGLAFADSEIDHLPHDHYDVPMDVIVTENGVLEF